MGQGSAGDVQTIGRRERGRNGEGRKSEEGGSYGRKSGTKGAVPRFLAVAMGTTELS